MPTNKAISATRKAPLKEASSAVPAMARSSSRQHARLRNCDLIIEIIIIIMAGGLGDKLIKGIPRGIEM
jgi:hypothetical protein